MSYDTAVLFLIYNRPDLADKVFEVLRQVQPPRLYIGSDGPQDNDDTDRALVAQARLIVDKVDWNCQVHTLYRDKNLGCKKAVSGALDWFFEQETEGIILEDDCIPDLSFFSYCTELLSRYRTDSRVMTISGQNLQGGIVRNKYSYYFSRYPHCWGWATWRRSWKLWDGDLKAWPELKQNGFIGNLAEGNSAFTDHWTRIFDKCFASGIDSWNYPWIFSCWAQNGLTILPNVNLVSNIGFGPRATHTKSETSDLEAMETFQIATPLDHPPWTLRDVQADNYTEKEVFGIDAQNKSNNCVTSVLQKIKHRLTTC